MELNEKIVELEENLAKIIAHPHTTIVKHDYQRAARIMKEIFTHIDFITNNINYTYSKYFSRELSDYLYLKYDSEDNSLFYEDIKI